MPRGTDERRPLQTEERLAILALIGLGVLVACAAFCLGAGGVRVGVYGLALSLVAAGALARALR